MKTLILAAVAVASLAATALPASAATFVREVPRHAVVMHEHRHAPVIVVRDHRHLRRVVTFDRFHHRHIMWR